MSMSEISFPRYVYQQAAQPSNVVTGAIWVDTDASPVSTWVYDGSNWNSLSTDVDWIAENISQIAINVLINSVAASATLNDYSEIFVDNFTDTSGTSNTIDMENTTSYFDTNKFNNNVGTPSESPATESDNSTIDTSVASQTDYYGLVFLTKDNLVFQQANKDQWCTATKAYLYAGNGIGGNLLATANFVSDVATFNDVLLTDATTYTIVYGSDGSSYTARNSSGGVTYPQNYTNVNFTGYVGTSAKAWNVMSIKTDSATIAPANTIIQTNSITIPSGITNHQLYCKNSIAGSGAISYDFSADGGSTWDTNQPLNNKNTFGASTGTSCKIKLNLNGTGSGNTSEASNYGIIIYT